VRRAPLRDALSAAIGQVLNDGLGRHEATFIIPAMYVLNTVLNIVGGELLYQVGVPCLP
jgi:hypothetical protein